MQNKLIFDVLLIRNSRDTNWNQFPNDDSLWEFRFGGRRMEMEGIADVMISALAFSIRDHTCWDRNNKKLSLVSGNNHLQIVEEMEKT